MDKNCQTKFQPAAAANKGSCIFVFVSKYAIINFFVDSVYHPVRHTFLQHWKCDCIALGYFGRSFCDRN